MTVGRSEARQRLAGIVLVSLSAVIFGLVDGFSKVLAESNSVGQLVWARYALVLPILLLTTRPSRMGGLFRTQHLALQIARGLAPLVVGAAMVLAVRFLPLTDATVILFATPLIVVAVSAPLLGERVSLSSWIAVAVGFAAVLVVARPGISSLSQYAVFPLVGAFFYAALLIITRKLAAAGEAPDTTLAWTVLVGFVGSLPFALIYWEPLDLQGWLLVLGIGVTFAASQLMLIHGYAMAPAALLAPLAYLQIVSAVAFGVVVFNEIPDWWTVLGIVMIAGAGTYVVRQRADPPPLNPSAKPATAGE